MVVKVVIRMGRILVAPASINAVSRFIVFRYWFTVSTYRIPALTTVPTSIRNPTKEIILMAESASHSIPKEPIKLNGIVIITIRENFSDSNCIAITTKIRKMAVAIAPKMAENSSFMD